jgi:cytochrome P450
MTSPEKFDMVLGSEYAEHGYPHEIWARWRREDPVHYIDQKEGIPYYAITKHDDVTFISKHPELFLNGPRLTISHLPEQPSDFPPTLIQLDPPKHGVYRQMVSRRFTPRMAARSSGTRLAASLRLDQSDHWSRGPRIPGEGKDSG